MDPLLLAELIEANPEWEVRRLGNDIGIFIGSDLNYFKLLETTEWPDENETILD